MNDIEYNTMARAQFRLLKEWTEYMVRIADELDKKTYYDRSGSEMRTDKHGHAYRHHFVEPLDLRLFCNELRERGCLPTLGWVLESLYKITKDVSRDSVREFLLRGFEMGQNRWEIVDACTFKGLPEDLPLWNEKLHDLDTAISVCLESFPVIPLLSEADSTKSSINDLFAYVAHQAKNLLIVLIC